jgi:hypothetical protein
MTSISVVSLGDRELDAHLELATSHVISFPVRGPEAKPAPAGPEAATLGGRRLAYRPLQALPGRAPAAERELRIAERIREIAPKDDLYTDVEHFVLRVLRRGIQVYLQIHDDTAKASGLDRLLAANQAGRLPARDEAELAEKLEAACAASLFAFAAYVATRLADAERAALEKLSFEVAAPGELPLSGRL